MSQFTITIYLFTGKTLLVLKMFKKCFFKKDFFRLKLIRELKFYAWIIIKGSKSLKKGQKMLKKATHFSKKIFVLANLKKNSYNIMKKIGVTI